MKIAKKSQFKLLSKVIYNYEAIMYNEGKAPKGER